MLLPHRAARVCNRPELPCYASPLNATAVPACSEQAGWVQQEPATSSALALKAPKLLLKSKLCIRQERAF